jgi:hypothetical protein
MSQWDIIVVFSLVITYLPCFWFSGMLATARSIVEEFGNDKIFAQLFIPGWAKKCAGISFAAHYCFVLLIVTLMDWVYGLAAFGAGMIPFVLIPLPLLAKTYRGIYRKKALSMYKMAPDSGKIMLKMLKETQKIL